MQKYKELVEKINNAKRPDDVRAEIAYLLRKFDPATLFLLEQAKNHSESLLEEWLSKHKFKHWRKRATSGRTVTPAYKKRRARQIAEIIGNPERWHSHGRGIGLRELTSEEIKLKVKDFGNDPNLNDKIRPYYDLLMDYSRKLGAGGPQHSVIHTAKGLRRL